MQVARPYQVEAVNAIRKHFFDGINNQLVELPTGTGKTVLFSILPTTMDIGKRRMLILVHTEELADQAATKLQKWNPGRTVGVEMGSRWAGDAQIVVGSVQTLGREGTGRLHSMQPESFAIVVTDEAHRATAPSYKRVYDHFGVRIRKDILNLGVTATSKRADGVALSSVYDVVSYSMTMLKAMKDGWLCDLRCGIVMTGVDFDKIGLSGSDFDSSQLSAALNTKQNNNAVVDHYIEHCSGRKFIEFCEDIAHSKEQAAAFRERGLAVEAVWGADPDRASKLERHRKRDLIGLVNAEMLTEGYDDSEVACVIINKHTLSESKFKQMVGRGTRIEAGINNVLEAKEDGVTLTKPDCYILDVGGNCKKHSLHTLPTLFGFGSKTKLGNKTVLEAVAEVEEKQKHSPLLTVDNLDDIGNINTYVEQFNLMQEMALPQIVQLSEFRWQRVNEDTYALPLKNDEAVFAVTDLIGKWHLKGTVNGYFMEGQFDELEEAIKEGDYKVRMLGGRMWTAVAKRKLKNDDKPASENWETFFKLRDMPMPPGLTNGQARALLARASLVRNWNDANQKQEGDPPW